MEDREEAIQEGVKPSQLKKRQTDGEGRTQETEKKDQKETENEKKSVTKEVFLESLVWVGQHESEQVGEREADHGTGIFYARDS